MDRRSVQISRTPHIQPKNCIHTKNVFSLVDLSPVDETYKKIRKHVDNCKVCDDAFKNFELNNEASRIQIPKPQIDSETKEIFAREVSDLFKAFDLNAKALLKKKIKNKIKHIDSLGMDFIKMLGSRQMLTTYAFGAVLFVVLKQFFN